MIGPKTICVLSLASGGSSRARFEAHRVLPQLRAAERNGLVEASESRRGVGGCKLVVLTAAGEQAWSEYIASECKRFSVVAE
jgi:DNA-binding MarR family transcriptional regulator